MIFSRPTKYGAGITLYGDLHDFRNLHEAIHTLSEADILRAGLADFVLGLAYEVRHAHQGDREVINLPANMMETENTTYFGFKSIWPNFLYQLGLLRCSAGFLPTSKDIQANLYRLEACAQTALIAYDPFVGNRCVDWLSRFQLPPRKYLLDYVVNCSLQYVTVGKPGKARFKGLPQVLRMLSGYSKEYREYEEYMESVAKEKGCQPEELFDLGEWPKFKW